MAANEFSEMEKYKSIQSLPKQVVTCNILSSQDSNI